MVDAIVSTRAEWDKTPNIDETWYEKTLTFLATAVKFLGKIAAQLSGFRPKPKAEIIIEEKK